MNRNDFGLVKSVTSAAPIPPRRVVAFAAAEGCVEVATSPTAKPLLGVTGIVGAAAAEQRVDVLMDGIRDVEAGAAFAQGVDLTVDAQGRVVAAVPGANATVRVIGTAVGLSVGEGQLVPVHIKPGSLSNPA